MPPDASGGNAAGASHRGSSGSVAGCTSVETDAAVLVDLARAPTAALVGVDAPVLLPAALPRASLEVFAAEYAAQLSATPPASLFERALQAWALQSRATADSGEWQALASSSLDHSAPGVASDRYGGFIDAFRALTAPRDALPNADMSELTASLSVVRERLESALQDRVPADVSTFMDPRGPLASFARSPVLDALFAPGASWLDPRERSALPLPSAPEAQYEASHLYWQLGCLVGFQDLTERAVRTVMGVLHLGLALEHALELIHAREAVVVGAEVSGGGAGNLTREELALGDSIFQLGWDVRDYQDALAGTRREAEEWRQKVHREEQYGIAAEARAKVLEDRLGRARAARDDSAVRRAALANEVVDLRVQLRAAARAQEEAEQLARDRDDVAAQLTAANKSLTAELKRMRSVWSIVRQLDTGDDLPESEGGTTTAASTDPPRMLDLSTPRRTSAVAGAGSARPRGSGAGDSAATISPPAAVVPTSSGKSRARAVSRGAETQRGGPDHPLSLSEGEEVSGGEEVEDASAGVADVDEHGADFTDVLSPRRATPTRRAREEGETLRSARDFQSGTRTPRDVTSGPGLPTRAASAAAAASAPTSSSHQGGYGLSAVLEKGLLRSTQLAVLDLLTALSDADRVQVPPPLRIYRQNMVLVKEGFLAEIDRVDFPDMPVDAVSPSLDDLVQSPKLMRSLTHRPATIGAYELGPVRGRSSTLDWVAPSDLHRARWFQCRLEYARGRHNITAAQTPYYANYAPLRSDCASAAASYQDEAGFAELCTLLETRPWDVMWVRRATRLYFLDVEKMKPDEQRWVEHVLEFQFRFRQAIWQHTHFVHVNVDKTGKAVGGAAWAPFYERRRQLDDVYFAGVCILERHRPASMSAYDDVFWLEPAFWRRPETSCRWLLDDPAETPLDEQLLVVDWEEPLRNQWTDWPGRFVEALENHELQRLTEDIDAGESPVPLPVPWCDAAYCPLPLHFELEGTPGPSFYTAEKTDAVFEAWTVTTTSLRRVMKTVKDTLVPPPASKRASAGGSGSASKRVRK